MYDNENNNMENGTVEKNNMESNSVENGTMENKNDQNNNVENIRVENSTIQNNSTENSVIESNNKMEENGNYRMTQGDIINNGITNIEQNEDVHMNTDNSNNVHSDNSIYNNMDNTINTVNADTNNNTSGMEANNNINNPYNNYSNNNATGYNHAAGTNNYNNGYGNNANYNGNMSYGSNNMNYGNNNMGYGNNNSANNRYAGNNNNSGYNPYNNPNNNINNKNPMNGKANNMNNNFNAKKVKNKSGIGKKIAAVALSAVMFGVIAGGTMYGVYYTANKIKPVNSNSGIQLPLVSSGAVLEGSDSFDNIKISSSEELNVKKVASAAMPAMVALSGTTQVSGGGSLFGGFGQNYQAQTSGTGIIVGKNDSELLVLTNAHVVENVNNLTCTFIDNESVECTVKGSKSNKDVAVVTVPLSSIKSSTINQIAIAELGDSDSVVLGQEVVAIGNALGKGQSVTSGIISALNRSITVDNVTFDNLIMTDAAINSGNSGGALLDASGKVVGINFAKTSADGVQGMAYAIPISNVRDLIDSLMNRETRTKVSESEMGYLGVNLLDVTSSVAEMYGYPQGTMIRAVEENSAADKAGLGVYDIIVSFDDQSITTSSSLFSTLQYYKAGETVKIEYYHIEGNEYVLKTADITLDKKSN